jgi:peptide/nickel transport system permease protein/oligopeptide transport system permease protein
MLETLDAEYIKFLRVKGLAERLIVWKHALRNALIPVVALSGIQLGNLLGGAVIVETVFSWPGLGNLMVESIVSRDYPVIQSGVLLIAVFLISLNFLVDLVFGVIDPRIRYT